MLRVTVYMHVRTCEGVCVCVCGCMRAAVSAGYSALLFLLNLSYAISRLYVNCIC